MVVAGAVSPPQLAGVRKLVFRHLDDYIKQANGAPPPIWTAVDRNADGTRTTPVPPPAVSQPQVGQTLLYSHSVPALVEGETYNVYATQRITWSPDQQDPKQGENRDAAHTPVYLQSQKPFKVQGSSYQLDESLIDSVYPPSGNGDYFNILPHVLFKNPQVPWSHLNAANQSSGDIASKAQAPWLGVLCFTEQELVLSKDERATLAVKWGMNTINQAPNLSVGCSPSLLQKISDIVASPVPNSASNDLTPTQAIFVPSSMFDKTFPVSGSQKLATASKFQTMCHVRRINTAGLTNKDPSMDSFSVAVSPRTGPIGTQTPTTMYAHLVSLVGIESVGVPSARAMGKTALISLYSWSYTCLPAPETSLDATLQTLSKNIQPLRKPDAQINRTIQGLNGKTWVATRMSMGYNLTAYQVQTGESTVACYHGMLTPTPPLNIPFTSSNWGTELAVLDRSTGTLDLTMQIAWQLGRNLAAADRTFCTALTCLRNHIHQQAWANARTRSVGDAFLATSALLDAIPTTNQQLGDLSLPTTQPQDFSVRWGTPNRYKRNLGAGNPQDYYDQAVQDAANQVGAAKGSGDDRLRGSPDDDYNELNTPASTDYAVILGWLMDKWYGQEIPFINLVPDPSFLPPESIRTFYVDNDFWTAFKDGALSLANHFTQESDTVRAMINQKFEDFLTQSLPNGCPPQQPRWGFLLRSQLVAKFPDLRIFAPFPNNDKSCAQVIRCETVATDTLLVLFDRLPSSQNFPQGLTIQPPEHQIRFSLGGSPSDVTASTIKLSWRMLDNKSAISGPYQYDTNTFCDPITGLLNTQAVADKARSTQDINSIYYKSGPNPNSALVGGQLMAGVPKIVFTFPPGGSMQAQSAGQGVQPVTVVPTGLSSASSQTQAKNAIETATTQQTTSAQTNVPAKTGTSIPAQVPAPIGTSSTTTVPSGSGSPSQGSVDLIPFPPAQSNPPTSGIQAASPSAPPPGGRFTLNFSNTSDYYLNSVIPLDMFVKIWCQVNEAKWLLQSIELGFPVGPATGSKASLLQPFAKASNIDVSNRELPANSSAPQPQDRNWPSRPNYGTATFPGLKIPTVTVTSLDLRWMSTVRWAPDGDISGSGTLFVKLTAKGQAGYWDASTVNNLSIVIEDAVLNYGATGGNSSQYNVTILETYTGSPSGWSGQTNGVRTAEVKSWTMTK